MKALILAAGYATRLYPLTENQPKALLPIAGKAIIDYILDEIVSIPAIDHVYVISNHKFAANFEEWLSHQSGKIPISIVDDGSTSEENKLGAIGDIQLAINRYAMDDDVLIIAGDTFFTFQLKDFYQFYALHQKDCFLVKEIQDIKQLQRMGVVELDETGRVVGFEEKPLSPKSNKASFAGYLYRSDTLPLIGQYLSEGGNPDAPGFFPAWLYTRKEVLAYPIQGECYDIGTPESYRDINQKMKF